MCSGSRKDKGIWRRYTIYVLSRFRWNIIGNEHPGWTLNSCVVFVSNTTRDERKWKKKMVASWALKPYPNGGTTTWAESMKIRYAIAELNIFWRKINAGGRYWLIRGSTVPQMARWSWYTGVARWRSLKNARAHSKAHNNREKESDPTPWNIAEKRVSISRDEKSSRGGKSVEYKLPWGSCPPFAILVDSRVYNTRRCAHARSLCTFACTSRGARVKEGKQTDAKGKNKCAEVRRVQEEKGRKARILSEREIT